MMSYLFPGYLMVFECSLLNIWRIKTNPLPVIADDSPAFLPSNKGPPFCNSDMVFQVHVAG